MDRPSAVLPDGILLVDKPKGWTSHDVVAKVRGALRQAALVESYKVESRKSDDSLNFQTFKPSTPLPKVKVGHTGTLDPLATGLMVVVVGSYTKRAQEFSKLDKTYQVAMKLGETSTTGDEEGIKTVVNTGQPSEKAIKSAINQFIGEIKQIPPAHSAIKINGKRAYQLAREGKTPDLKPRQVTIYGISDVTYNYPNISFVVKVSSGTYIRSLVEDIGNKLATGAYMTDLRRTTVGGFDLTAAVGPEDPDILQKIHPI